MTSGCFTFLVLSGVFLFGWFGFGFGLFCLIFLFIFETERDRVRAGEGQREWETQNSKQAPSSELSAQSPRRGLNSQAVRS